MAGYWKKPKRETTSEKPTFLVPIKNFTMPRALYNRVKEYSDKMEIPLTRLINYAIYNEMEMSNAFEFDMTMPNKEYVPMEFAKEASLLMNLINDMPNDKGLGLDQLLLAKEAARIYDKDTLLLAYRELIENKMVYETHPSEFRIPGHYHKDFVQVAPMKVRYTTEEFKNKKLNGEGPLSDAIKTQKRK